MMSDVSLYQVLARWVKEMMHPVPKLKPEIIDCQMNVSEICSPPSGCEWSGPYL